MRWLAPGWDSLAISVGLEAVSGAKPGGVGLGVAGGAWVKAKTEGRGGGGAELKLGLGSRDVAVQPQSLWGLSRLPDRERGGKQARR